MSRRDCSSAFAVAVVTLGCLALSPAALAQDDYSSTTTTMPIQIESCNDSLSMDVDLTEFAGTWWEVARNPATPDMLCVEVDFTVHASGHVDIATTYSNTPVYPYVNQTMTTSIVVNTTHDAYEAGYNISYVNGLTNTTHTVFKLLDTDYINYALICGYTNASDASTAFALVLTRLRVPNTKLLDGYIVSASERYADFVNNSMTMVNQDAACTGSPANALRISHGSLLIALIMLMLMTRAES